VFLAADFKIEIARCGVLRSSRSDIASFCRLLSYLTRSLVFDSIAVPASCMFALSAALEDQKQFLSEDELCDFANAILAMTKIENMARDDYCKTAAYECMSVPGAKQYV
jgi:hypothetical protein